MGANRVGMERGEIGESKGGSARPGLASLAGRVPGRGYDCGVELVAGAGKLDRSPENAEGLAGSGRT
jgi:hypothetical protein